MATLRKMIGHAHLIGDLEPVASSQAESAREPGQFFRVTDYDHYYHYYYYYYYYY